MSESVITSSSSDDDEDGDRRHLFRRPVEVGGVALRGDNLRLFEAVGGATLLVFWRLLL